MSSIKGAGIIDTPEMLNINQTPDWRPFNLALTTTPVEGLLPVVKEELPLINEVRFLCATSDIMVSNDPAAPADQWATWPAERILVIPLNDAARKIYVKLAAGTANLQGLAFGFRLPSQA